MKDRLDLLLKHEELLHKNIRLADQKSAVLITLNLAILTVLIRTEIIVSAEYKWLLACVYFGLATVVLGTFGVLKPRGRKYKFDPNNLALPKDLGAYQSAIGEFWDADEGDVSQLELDLQKLVVQRAKINKTKYDWLNGMTYYCFCVWALSALTLAMIALCPIFSSSYGN